ncbi:MAG: hypothetical protein KAJ64_00270, partial [Thermoplasmata archaeon]|nr:hypothetical protein [Thermoplasmata archaeon]
MALFKKKKKKDDEPDASFDEGIGMTGSLAEEEKGGFFGRKKDKKEIEEPDIKDEEEIIDELPADSVECDICGNLSPPGSLECGTCGGTLSKPDEETEAVDEMVESEMDLDHEMPDPEEIIDEVVPEIQEDEELPEEEI